MRRPLPASLRLGLGLCLLVLALAAAGAVWTPFPPQAMDLAHAMAGPGPVHLLGTDDFGRDLLSRLLVGMRLDLMLALASVLLSGAAGLAVGLLAARLRGLAGDALMRLVDLLYAFPAILTALMLVTVMGASTTSLVVVLAAVNLPVFVRLTRSMALSLNEQPFVEAARAAGAGPWRIALRHVLPGVLPTLLVQAATALSGAFFTEAALSYLGLGVQPPTPTLGNMLSEAQGFLAVDPWMAVPPGLAVALCVLAFNTLGDGLRDRLAPGGGPPGRSGRAAPFPAPSAAPARVGRDHALVIDA